MSWRRPALALGAGLVCTAAAAVWWLELGRVAARPEIPATGFATPPSEALRLVTMGTSLTAHYDWPKALADQLSLCLDQPVALQTVARGGETSRWGLAQVGRVLAGTPHVVVIEFVANDADLRHRLSPSESRANHAEIITRIQAAAPEARILLLGMNPVYGLRGAARPRMGAYLANYVTLAQGDPRIGFLDTTALWLDHIARSGRADVLPDGLHPDAGVAKDVAVAALEPAISALWSAPCA